MSHSPYHTMQSPTTIQLDNRRFRVCIFVCLYSFSNAMQWITYAPIVEEVKEYFNMNTAQLNSMSWIYMVTYMLLVPVSCAVVERVGLKKSIAFGAFLNATGSALKIFAAVEMPEYWLVFLAQLLNALGQLFVLSCPPQVAAMWFPSDERTIATAVMSMANNMGNAVGLMFPPLLVNHHNKGAEAFTTLFIIQACLCIPVAFCIFFGLPEQPTTPPSAAASPLTKQERAFDAEGYHRGVRSCVSRSETARSIYDVLTNNRSFVFLWLSFSISCGSCWALNSVLAQLVGPFGVSEGQAGWMGFSNIFLGTFASLVIGNHVDKNRKYKGPFLALNAFTVIMLATWSGSLAFGPASSAVFMCFVWYILAGISQNAVVPVCFEYSLELTFPEPEAVTSGLLIFGANTFSFIMLNIASTILGEEPTVERSETVMTMLLIMSIVGTGCAVLVKGALLRFEMESAQASPTIDIVSSSQPKEEADTVCMTTFEEGEKAHAHAA